MLYWLQREAEGGKGRGRKTDDAREKHQLVASGKRPAWGLNPQPRHVPWPGNEPATFRFIGQCSNQATPAGALTSVFRSKGNPPKIQVSSTSPGPILQQAFLETAVSGLLCWLFSALSSLDANHRVISPDLLAHYSNLRTLHRNPKV